MYLKVEDLSFKYKNAKSNTLNQVSFNVEKGDIVGVLGESGSGKSTLLRLVAGLEDAHEGAIYIQDKVIFNASTNRPPERRGIGMVFQDYALFPHMTVAKNIMFGLKGMTAKEKNTRMIEMLELVNLLKHKDKYPYELSGGQQQRIAIARALAPKPQLLLLDEPFSNLDAHLQSKIREDLKEILNKEGMTSIFVTHDQEDVDAIADYVIRLNHKGEVIK